MADLYYWGNRQISPTCHLANSVTYSPRSKCVLQKLQHPEHVIRRMNSIHDYGESPHVNHSFRVDINGNTYLPDNKEKVLGDTLANRMNINIKYR